MGNRRPRRKARQNVKVLVTGATSLLARTTAEILLKRGDDVVCLQRGQSALAAEQVSADIRDADAVLRAASGCDAIVHAAAKVGVVGSWDDYRGINVDGTNNVLAAARAAGIQRVVYVSSPSVAHGGDAIAGLGAEPPVLGRKNAYYAESKAMAEQAAVAANKSDLAVVAIRPHLVWGPGDTQLVGRILDRARSGRLALVGGGAALIDTTYITNAAESLVAALDRVRPDAACAGRAYVIANGEPRPIRDLVAGICAAAGVPFAPKDVPLPLALVAGSLVERIWKTTRRTTEPPLTRFLAEQLGTAHWFDPRPAKEDLGWTPRITIDQGLEALFAWFSQPPT
jgi:2-alkyl-3-oxoalkanoate reductase